MDPLYGMTDDISIHDPRMGSDKEWCNPQPSTDEISIHAPRMGSDAG